MQVVEHPGKQFHGRALCRRPSHDRAQDISRPRIVVAETADHPEQALVQRRKSRLHGHADDRPAAVPQQPPKLSGDLGGFPFRQVLKNFQAEQEVRGVFRHRIGEFDVYQPRKIGPGLRQQIGVGFVADDLGVRVTRRQALAQFAVAGAEIDHHPRRRVFFRETQCVAQAAPLEEPLDRVAVAERLLGVGHGWPGPPINLKNSIRWVRPYCVKKSKTFISVDESAR